MEFIKPIIQAGTPGAGKLVFQGKAAGGDDLVIETAGDTTLRFPSTTGSLPWTYFTVTAPTGTANTTGVMMGMGSTAKYTPVKSGVVLIMFNGNVTSATVGAGAESFLRFGAGTAPANGAVLGGTVISNAVNDIIPIASGQCSCSTSGIMSGAFLGTEYWFDMSLRNFSVAGTVTFVAPSFTIIEL